MTKRPGLMGRIQAATEAAKDIEIDPSLRMLGPKTAPGKMIHAHQELAIARKELETVKNKKLPIIDLHEVEGRKRSLSKEEFETLKKNLEHNPLGQPIVVKLRQHGGYEIIAGHNRVQAYRDLGRTEIEAHILEIGDEEAFKVGFYTNLITSNLSDFEKYLGFKEVLKESGMTHEKVADEAGVDRSLVSKLLNAYEQFSAQAKAMLHQNPHAFGLSAAQELVKAKEDGIIRAIAARTADPKMAEKIAVQLAFNEAATSVKKDADSRVVKSGKSTFATITKRPGLVSVRLKNAEFTQELESKIYQLVEEFEGVVKLSHS